MRPGGVCYLDVTLLLAGAGGVVDAVQDYYKGWMGTVLDSGSMQPGTRCRSSDAPGIVAALRAVYAERRRTVQQSPLWIVGTQDTARGILAGAAPTASTGAGRTGWRADIWEASDARIIRETYGGVTLALRACIASRPDPSFALSTVDAATYAAALRPAVTPSPDRRVWSSSAIEARQLMEACLGVLATIQAGSAAPFPNGVAAVEVETSERKGETDARIQVRASP
jgi:hypothetical protein